MFSALTKQLIAASKYRFKLGSSLKAPLAVRHRVLSYLYRREFASTTGLAMEDNQETNSGAALVAVCQMNSTNDVERNLGICKDLVKKAKSRGAKVKLTDSFTCIAPVCFRVVPLGRLGYLGRKFNFRETCLANFVVLLYL